MQWTVIFARNGTCAPTSDDENMIRVSYDPEADALYIRLLDGEHECRTVRLNEEIALNIGEGEKLVGIEILDAKEVLGAGKLPTVAVENLPVEGA
jgi:uncharacterized protein YuzE